MPQACAQRLQDALLPQGLLGTLGTSVPYGQKVHVYTESGLPLGTVIIYIGKRGPQLVTNELRQASAEHVRTVEAAWRTVLGHSEPSEHSGSAPAQSSPGSLATGPRPDQGVALWVDGSCLANAEGLRFGWAYVVIQDSQELHRDSGTALFPGSHELRQVGAELMAVIVGLAWCLSQRLTQVTIAYDYAGIAAWPTGEWRAKTPVTQAYVQAIRAFPGTLTWRKITAHSGQPDNELVNRLAQEAAKTSPLIPHPACPPQHQG